MERSLSGLDSLVVFQNSQGIGARGSLLHITRSLAVFEVYNPYSVVQLSEVLHDLQILRGDRIVYRGRAVVSNLVSTGLMLIVSATLVDPWQDLVGAEPGKGVQEEVEAFVRDWEVGRRIRASYQLTVGWINSFLAELSRWLDHMEASRGAADSPKIQREFTLEVEAALKEKLTGLFTRFESEASQVEPDEVVSHKAYARRQLHPLMLVAPFIHRTFTKPLGYAGDFEMVNMILRDPLEGPSTYARILNALILRSDGAQAHRNRIDRLVAYLSRERARVSMEGREFVVVNVGCGPAAEVERFVRTGESSGEFHLVDFNRETLEYTRRRLEDAAAATPSAARIVYHHKSVNELLKEAVRHTASDPGGAGPFPPADLLYCAGLFDYLSDRVCRRLMQLFHAWLKPEGLLVVTNVHPRNGVRYFLQHVLEWNLIYRTEDQMEDLGKEFSRHSVDTDETGVNVFLEVRKDAADRLTSAG